MSLIRCALVSTILLAGTRSASAMCGEPGWYGTPAGVALPAKGVLYRFDAFAGGEAGIEWYDAADASELVRFDHGDEVRFPIDRAWKAPAAAPRVLAIQHTTHRWSCSSENALAIQLDQPVAAVKVFWATSEGTHEIVVAPKPRETPRGRPASMLLLGKLDCAGENVPVEDLERGVVLGLTAIRHDGTEVPIEGVPTTVAMSDFPTTRAPAPLGFDVVGDDPEIAAPEVPWRPRTNGAMPIALVVGAIVLGARRGLAGAAAGRVRLPSAAARRR